MAERSFRSLPPLVFITLVVGAAAGLYFANHSSSDSTTSASPLSLGPSQTQPSPGIAAADDIQAEGPGPGEDPSLLSRKVAIGTVASDFFVEASQYGFSDSQVSELAAALRGTLELGKLEAGSQVAVMSEESRTTSGNVLVSTIVSIRIKTAGRAVFEAYCYQSATDPSPSYRTRDGQSLSDLAALNEAQSTQFKVFVKKAEAAYDAAERNGGSLVLALTEPRGSECPPPKARIPASTNSSLSTRDLRDQSAETNYSLVAFDPSVASLPPRFAGHDPEAFMRVAEPESRKYKKDEFETTQQMKDRIANLPVPKFIGELGAKDTFTFRVDPLLNEYDADHERLTLTLMATRCADGFEKYDKGGSHCEAGMIQLSVETIKDEPYSAHNALGASVEARKREQRALGVIDGDRFRRPTDGVSRPHLVELTIPLANAKAREAKGRTSVLLLFRPKAPYADRGYFSSEPTFKDPLDYSLTARALLGDTLAIWVYNFETGEIYKKFER